MCTYFKCFCFKVCRKTPPKKQQLYYYTLESQILSTSQSRTEQLDEISPSGRKKVNEGEAPGMRAAVSFVVKFKTQHCKLHSEGMKNEGLSQINVFPP